MTIETISADATTGTADAITAVPVPTLTADEHQLLIDLKVAGHDLTVLFKDIIAKV